MNELYTHADKSFFGIWPLSKKFLVAACAIVLLAGCQMSSGSDLDIADITSQPDSSDAIVNDGTGEGTVPGSNVAGGDAETGGIDPAQLIDATPLPAEVALWEKNMLTYGQKWGDFIGNSGNSGTAKLNAYYYDLAWVFQQIALYTGNKEPWLTYANKALKVYRDNYLVPNNFKTPGYWRFSHGLYGDFAIGGSTTIAQIRSIRDNPAFSKPDVDAYAPGWYHAMYAREVAYAIHAQLTAEKAGEPRNETRMQMFLAMAANHLKQWRTANYTNPSNTKKLDFLQPFMFSLTAHALIDFYEWEKSNGRNPDAYVNDIPGTLAEFSRWMYNEAKVRAGAGAGERLWCANVGGASGSWNDAGGTGYGAFRYNDLGAGSEPAVTPDLNLLIAPVYAWTYMMTGDADLRTAADKIFGSGAKLAAVSWNGKIFTQNYRWSMRYVQWRKDGDKTWAKAAP